MPDADEAQRQRDLDTYRILDTLPQAAYDDIARLASLLCGAPIALVSLIDRDRQWFKARTGFEPDATRRDEAFCNHAIRAPGQVMEIPDATQDPRFAANPLVTGDAAIRFYAGMPLVTPGGSAIGTVCVLDRAPRMLTQAQRDGLASLARITMNLLDARRREQSLALGLQLRESEDTAASAVPDLAHRTVAVFEAQRYAGAVARVGERAAERILQQLEDTLERALLPGTGDNVSRATGSPEVIAVLHGQDADAAFDALRSLLPAFERDHGLRVLAASAQAKSADERIEMTFLRAEAALSDAKDAGLAG
jgi:GAF domain-containing protein